MVVLFYSLCAVVGTEDSLNSDHSGSHDGLQPSHVQQVINPGGRIAFCDPYNELLDRDAFS